MQDPVEVLSMTILAGLFALMSLAVPHGKYVHYYAPDKSSDCPQYAAQRGDDAPQMLKVINLLLEIPKKLLIPLCQRLKPNNSGVDIVQ
jgi:hypothetical protein